MDNFIDGYIKKGMDYFLDGIRHKNKISIGKLTPVKIVSNLDKYIVGQDNAKRAVAIALRNRWR